MSASTAANPRSGSCPTRRPNHQSARASAAHPRAIQGASACTGNAAAMKLTAIASVVKKSRWSSGLAVKIRRASSAYRAASSSARVPSGDFVIGFQQDVDAEEPEERIQEPASQDLPPLTRERGRRDQPLDQEEDEHGGLEDERRDQLLGVIVRVVPAPEQGLRAQQCQRGHDRPGPAQCQEHDPGVEDPQIEEERGVLIGLRPHQDGREQAAEDRHQRHGRRIVLRGQDHRLDDDQQEERRGGALGDQVIEPEGAVDREVEQDDTGRRQHLREGRQPRCWS